MSAELPPQQPATDEAKSSPPPLPDSDDLTRGQNGEASVDPMTEGYKEPDLKINIKSGRGRAKLKRFSGSLAVVRGVLTGQLRPTSAAITQDVGNILRRYGILFQYEQDTFDLWCYWLRNGTSDYQDEDRRAQWLAMDWRNAPGLEKIVVCSNLQPSRICDTTGWLSQRFAFVENIGGRCRIVEVFDNEYIYHTLGDAKEILTNIKAYDTKAQPLETEQGRHMAAFEAWTKSQYRRNYKRIVFEPIASKRADPDEFVEFNGCLNLWRGFKTKPKRGDVGPILDHLRSIVANNNESHFQYIVSWLARMMQQPNKPAETALVFISGQGAGKNIVFDMIADWFGEHGVVTTNVQLIAGQYNDIVENKCLIVINEAVRGDKQVAGGLKNMITEHHLTIHKKFHAPYRIKNCSHLVFMTNSGLPVEMDNDDRRYCVTKMSDKRIGDKKYFRDLALFIQDGGSEAFLDYLMNLNIQDWDYRDIPIDDIKSMESITEIKLKSMHHAYTWLFQALFDGKMPYVTEINSPERFVYHEAIPHWANLVDTYNADKVNVHLSYKCWARNHEIRNDIYTVQRIVRMLTKIEIANSDVVWSQGSSRRVLKFETLGTSRFLFARFMGLSRLFDAAEKEERKMRRGRNGLD